ncbi:DNA glycosylase [Apiospora saccharicola]|uniref:DNA glycosylase n=1 Tax=Apiospora saccharicola TaxID=335842 RepID=A0ABR1W511_9PEZI
MARATASTTTVPLRRSGRNSSKVAKEEEQDVKIKPEAIESPRGVEKRIASASPTPGRRGSKRVKKEVKEEEDEDSPEDDEPPTKRRRAIKTESPHPSPSKKKKSSSTSTPKKSQDEKAAELQARKLKAYMQFANASPFPDFARPTPDECKLAHRILTSLHGAKTRPSEPITQAPANRAGCGDAPSVLDALVRTVLSQNTSDRNSSRAKLSMDQVYGGSDKWEAIVAGGQQKLEKTIQSGGLAANKSRTILRVLEQAHAKYGKYSLDHLFEKSDEDAMAEMLGFQGVGPKTASCVLLFCMRRESFAVDTHVYRLTGLLGWLPTKGGKVTCNREQAQAHLDARVPAEDKYGLHVLLIRHGKDCAECKAGGRSTGKCELRKAFRGAKVDGEVGEELKEEEIEHVKEEVDGVETDRDAVANTIEMMS